MPNPKAKSSIIHVQLRAQDIYFGRKNQGNSEKMKLKIVSNPVIVIDIIFISLSPLAPISQNGQTHSNNSLAICRRIV